MRRADFRLSSAAIDSAKVALVFYSMADLVFPKNKSIFEDRSYTKEFLEMSIAEVVANKKFTGFIRIDTEKGRSLLLFFLQGNSYAAGELIESRPSPVEIKELFSRLPSTAENAWLSLHETDPVLLKDLLVFFQREPSLKAMTDLINLEGVLEQVRQESSDAVLILRNGSCYNFFFIKRGRLVMSHFAESGFMETSLSISEQIQKYAYRADGKPVEAFLYRETGTSQASDAEGLRENDLLDLLSSKAMQAPSERETKPSFPEKKIPVVVLSLLDGKEKGKLLSSSVPCIVGRKEANIIVSDSKVSRHHALLKIYEGKPFIEDMQSTNGTYVNSVEVKKAALKPGDVITIGETRLEFKSCELAAQS